MANLLQVAKLALYAIYSQGARVTANEVTLDLTSAGVRISHPRRGLQRTLFYHQMSDQVISDYWSILWYSLCHYVSIYYKPYKLLKDLQSALGSHDVNAAYDTEIGIREVGYTTVSGRNHMVLPYDNCDIACDYDSDSYEHVVDGYKKDYVRLIDGNTLTYEPNEAFRENGVICIFYPDSMDIIAVMKELTRNTPVSLDKEVFKNAPSIGDMFPSYDGLNEYANIKNILRNKGKIQDRYDITCTALRNLDPELPAKFDLVLGSLMSDPLSK